MSFAIPIVLLILFLAGSITLLVFSWKKDDTLLWIFNFLLDVIAQIVFFAMASSYTHALLKLSDAQIVSSNYAQYSMVCLFFALVFATLTLISIVLIIGRKVINKQERGY